MNTFLPEGYDKIPSSSRYMKLKEGENTFRVLSVAVTGWLYWNTANKPVRFKNRLLETPNDIRTESDGKPAKIKHFWAFVVWNYDEKMIQLLEVTQNQIMTGIKALVDSKHWGDPKGYDISISRSGSGFETEYVTQGIPPIVLSKTVADEYAKLTVNLEGLFTGEDPFAGSPATKPSEPAAESAPLPAEPPPTPDRYATLPTAFRPKA